MRDRAKLSRSQASYDLAEIAAKLANAIDTGHNTTAQRLLDELKPIADQLHEAMSIFLTLDLMLHLSMTDGFLRISSTPYTVKRRV